MMSFAAIMVLVACQSDQASCVQEPVVVISYVDSKACRADLDHEIRKAERLAALIYGDCIPVDPYLLAGRVAIRQEMSAEKLAALMPQKASPAKGLAMALVAAPLSVPMPLERYERR
ncbi:hypothetical protein HGO38_21185 [Rhizobium sp. CG5]|uniref:hypothetical protein n=1 Tax=Rhizobium sp. CG5 TaxID=2726076 RepID=UPI002034A5D2|nr:hypothetical protein [Rhizobium sp. CG5]MCM2475993.1 hypothetical protein [Rhizobium sp. CG5]